MKKAILFLGSFIALFLWVGKRDTEAHEPIFSSFVSGLVVEDPGNYVYAPAAFWDGKAHLFTTRGFIFGDFVIRGESSNPWGPWQGTQPVFGPTASPLVHDGAHTADPSVILINGVMFLYYTSHPTPDSVLPDTSSIGVCWSWDGGQTFHRVFQDPIVRPHRITSTVAGEGYGCGQPVAIWRAPYVYLFFSDSTGPGSNPVNGGSVYCIRSTDAFFKSGIEELRAEGFVNVGSTADLERTHSIADAYSVDVQWISQTSQFVMAINGLPGHTAFRFFDANVKPMPQHDFLVPQIGWREGPGFLRTKEGHALPHASGLIDRTTFIWYYPTGGESPFTWDLSIAGIDVMFR